ncbi:hypothetical protein SNK03_004039 [Fusarium graminearum]|uniref:4-hydroxybenzoate polyprenyltransferase, mitochondrial n=1 Tax=Fusarium austroamericanum TaxID=282268 RepID=A0AAN6BUM1_FUSAU|nr:hypothetical protein FAUST_11907 [Fusarium austroamericanum]PCD21668.1 hypothetical protein FGRA07_11570 [Fusarium graminearum]CAF3433764.1 unnamed protein product [Fusarium graminearum]
MSATTTIALTARTSPSKGTRASKKKSLSKQYGGIHAGSWVDVLPKSWIPYVQLSRLSPPVGLILIYFPHLFGVVHAASVQSSSISEVLYISSILAIGSFFCNNGSHAWNDLVDAPIDAKIERTKMRPIPRGAISRQAAFAFSVSQATLAAACLLPLGFETALATIPTILATLYYPFAKRHTYFAQVVLGFCLTWGVMVGSSSMGVEAPWKQESAVSLLLASNLWVILFDTVYAHQDLEDDLKVGVKSLAVLFNGRARPLLWTLFLGMCTCLYWCGVTGGLGVPYFVITVGGCAVSVGSMVALVDLKDPESCWKWFATGFWFTALSILAGLSANYVLP